MGPALRVLGGVSLELNGVPVGGRAAQRHRLALLTLLSVAPSGMSKDRLVALLWPEAEPDRARRLLSHCLYTIRAAVGRDAVVTGGDAVRLGASWECDVRAFEQAVGTGALEEAAQLYAGPFVDGFYLADNAEYEHWVDEKRATLGRTYAGVLEGLALERESVGDALGAAGWWQRLASLDPHDSRTALRLVRAMDASGSSGGALRHARAHEALIRQELGIPTPIELQDEIRRLTERRVDPAPNGSGRTVSDLPRTPQEPALGAVLEGAPMPSARPGLAGERQDGGPARAPRARRRRWGVAGALVVVVVAVASGLLGVWGRTPEEPGHPEGPVLAVLPFEDLSADPEQSYFADALTDLVITELARMAGLTVISRTSVERYRLAQPSALEIGSRLNAAFVVRGTVHRQAEQVRVTVRLIDASNDRYLWADSYERTMSDLFALQSDLAFGIAHRIGVAVRRPGGDTHIVREATAAAHEAYLKGLYHTRTTGLEYGIEWFEQAVVQVPTYAPAFAGIARNLYFLAFFGRIEPEAAFTRMLDASEAALSIDPSVADAHATRALVLMHRDQDWRGAEHELLRAIELEPGNAQVHHDYAHLLLIQGRLVEAARESRLAVVLDPVNPGLEACLTWHQVTGRDYEAAVEQGLLAVSIAPRSFWSNQTLGWAYEQVGRRAEAIASLARAVEYSGGMPFTRAALGHALAASGDQGAARELLSRLQEDRVSTYVSPYDLAAVHVALAEPEAAMELLGQAQHERSTQLVHLGIDPRFVPLRERGEFRRLLRDLGLDGA